MATLAGENSPSPTLSGTGYMDESCDAIIMRKRPREFFDDSFDDGQWELTDDGRPKTRRVNPQRLAVRLGPDLVAEMEALIIPGAKMPTFNVRKDFQERYNVDRRHIYDYFHSRGLRVAKEDKHTNLIRGRAMKAQAQAQAAQLQALSQPPSSPSAKQEPQVCETSLIRPFLVETVKSPVIKPRGRIIKQSLKAQEKKPRATPVRRATKMPKSLKGGRGSEFLVTPPSLGDVADLPPTMASCGTDAEREPIVPICPHFTFSSAHSDADIKDTGDMPDFLPSPDDFVAGYLESTLDDTQQSFMDMESNLTCDSLDLDILMNAEEHRLLTRAERNELYDFIDTNIPRAGNFEEPAQTYNDYMNDQLLPYFDCLPDACNADAQSHWKSGASSTYSSPAIDSPISVDIPDLRKWLADDVDVFHPVMNLHEYNPIRDSVENNCTISEVTTREALRADMASLQVHNKVISGKLYKSLDQTNKQGSQYQLENIKPSGT